MNVKIDIKKGVVIAAMAIAGLAPIPAAASTLLGYIDSENDCAGVFGTPPDCTAYWPYPADPNVDPLLEPTPLIVKFDYDPDKTELGNFASITGGEFDVDFNSNGSGSWTYTPGPDDPIITAFVIKDGNGFWLFASSGNSGSWAADEQQGGQGISHISFYDGGGTVPPEEIPEPAALGLLGLGLASIALIRRRRK